MPGVRANRPSAPARENSRFGDAAWRNEESGEWERESAGDMDGPVTGTN